MVAGSVVVGRGLLSWRVKPPAAPRQVSDCPLTDVLLSMRNMVMKAKIWTKVCINTNNITWRGGREGSGRTEGCGGREGRGWRVGGESSETAQGRRERERERERKGRGDVAAGGREVGV